MQDIFNLPVDGEVDVRIFGKILSTSLTNSYKIYWFKSIYEYIIKGEKEISFYNLVVRMIANAWYSITRHKLNFGVSDQLGKIVDYLYETYTFLDEENTIDDLQKKLNQISDKNLTKMIKGLYNYVPYRLLSTFFDGKVKESEKNKYIEEQSNLSDIAIYKIDTKNEKITINDNYYKYIYNNQSVINSWINYNLIIYLQKRNANVPNIPAKLDPPHERNLSKAIKFWKAILKENNLKDIYTGKELDKNGFDVFGTLSIDHYIPWSFVMHDEMWDLVPTFKNINSSKNNKLPNIEDTLNAFCDIQYIAFTYIKSKKNSKELEDYLNINNNMQRLCMNDFVSKEEFIEALKLAIMPLYQIAYNQGYKLWQKTVA
ncbi:MAG: HNH endonuclease domain-containing protein [Clostridia bacterium]